MLGESAARCEGYGPGQFRNGHVVSSREASSIPSRLGGQRDISLVVTNCYRAYRKTAGAMRVMFVAVRPHICGNGPTAECTANAVAAKQQYCAFGLPAHATASRTNSVFACLLWC